MEEQRAWGFDVSRFQAGISFIAARAAGASFAFVRASTGQDPDPAFAEHVCRGRGDLALHISRESTDWGITLVNDEDRSLYQ